MSGVAGLIRCFMLSSVTSPGSNKQPNEGFVQVMYSLKYHGQLSSPDQRGGQRHAATKPPIDANLVIHSPYKDTGVLTHGTFTRTLLIQGFVWSVVMTKIRILGVKHQSKTLIRN